MATIAGHRRASLAWQIRALGRVAVAVLRRYGRASLLLGGALGGIGLAVALLVVFVREQAADTVRLEMIAVADRAIALADETITNTGQALTEIANGGATKCGAAEVEAFRTKLAASRWIADIGIADAEGRLLCHAAGEASRALPLLPAATERLPRLALHADSSPGRRTIIVAWSLSDGVRLFAVLSPDEPRMPGGPAFAAGRLKVAVELLSGAPWRVVGAQASSGETTTFIARSERYPLRGVVTIPADLMPVAFRWLQFQLAALGLAIAAGTGFLIFGRILRSMPKAVVPVGIEFEGALRPFYRPVIEVATGRMVGIDLVASRERADGSLMHDQVPVLDRQFLSAAFADVAPVLARHRSMRFTIALPDEAAAAQRAITELIRQIERSDVDTGQIVVLATPGRSMTLAELRACIARVRAIGCGVSFGGLWQSANITDTLRLHPDMLSLDGDMIDDLTFGPEAAAVVSAMVMLASKLGIETVARGLTREAQLDPLHAAGIATAAGDIFGAPLTAGAISDLTGMIARDIAGTAARERRAA